LSYKMVHDRFWNDPRVRKLSFDAKGMYFFLYTNPLSHYTGLYHLQPYIICNELSIDTDRLDKAISELQIAPQNRIGLAGADFNNRSPHLVKYDPEFGLWWIVDMLPDQIHNACLNSKQLKGVLNYLLSLPESVIISEFIDFYDTFFKKTFTGQKKEIIQSLSNGLEAFYVKHGKNFSLPDSPIQLFLNPRTTTTAYPTTYPTTSKIHTCGAGAPRREASTQKLQVTEDEIVKLYAGFNGSSLKVKEFIAAMAAENSTGTIKLTRIRSVLTELFEIYNSYGPDAFAHGISAANTKGAANINYAKKAMANYKPGKELGSNGDNTGDVWKQSLEG